MGWQINDVIYSLPYMMYVAFQIKKNKSKVKMTHLVKEIKG